MSYCQGSASINEMFGPRKRALVYAAGGVVAVWLLAWAGFALSQRSKASAENMALYLRSVDLNKLSGKERERALRRLADQMKALSIDERRRTRLEGEWNRWFEAMTEEEKSAYLEATLPSGFKQMLTSFEQLPEDKRKRAIGDAVKELKKAREAIENGDDPGPIRPGTNAPPDLSPQLQKKILTIGLNSYYSSSSAQSKVDLAPLLEEIQRSMENGRLFRGGR
jgi:hypothetical protein